MLYVAYFLKGGQLMKQTKKAKKVVGKGRKIFRIFLITLLCLVFLGIVVVSGMVLAIVKDAPALNINQILDLKETSIIYDDQGNTMDDLIVTDKSNQIVKRTVVTLNNTSPNLRKAFVSIEDERFYKHKGVDYRGVTRAVLVDIQNKIFHKNKSIQGASTITQQLIKNRLFLNDSLNNRLDYKRKIQEAYLALELEKRLSKDEILEAYMNTIFLGGTANGVEAASNQYFNKSSKDLTLIESAFIAGVAQSPTYFYPFTTSARLDHSIYLNKTKLVLSKMYETKSISKQEYDQAISELNTKGDITFNRPTTNSDKYTYEWFSRPTVDQIKKDLVAQYGYSQTQVTNLLMSGGLKIYTTMNKALQDKAQNIMNTDEIFNKVANESSKPLQASAVIMDYHTAQVKVIIGGRNEKDQPPIGYNRAADVTNFHRATGSSIKPLTVYSAAIDSKMATPSTLIEDTKLSPALVAQYGFDPNDDDFKQLGSMTIRQAIAQSRNLVAVKLEDKIGLNVGYAYADKFGIKLYDGKKDGLKHRDGTYYSDKGMAALALGQLDYGTNPLAMAAAYGVFGSSGMYATPRLYTKVVDKTGKTLLETKYTARKAIEPQTAYIMWDLLKGPIHDENGTGRNANLGDMPAGGKTGTATNGLDLWFCGLTPYYSAAVWIGNDDYKPFKNLYSSDAASIWKELMKEANANLIVKDIPPPAGLESVKICKASGKRATDLCSQDSLHGNNTYTDVFIPGQAPTETCDEHVQVKIDKVTNKLASDTTPADQIILKVFLKADIPKESDDTKPAALPVNQNNNNNTDSNSNTSNAPTTNTGNTETTNTDPTIPKITLPKINLPKITIPTVNIPASN